MHGRVLDECSEPHRDVASGPLTGSLDGCGACIAARHLGEQGRQGGLRAPRTGPWGLDWPFLLTCYSIASEWSPVAAHARPLATRYGVGPRRVARRLRGDRRWAYTRLQGRLTKSAWPRPV